jgi:outer membrane biogenesis lipoprotein LolB
MKSVIPIVLLVLVAGCSPRQAQKSDSSSVSVNIQGSIDPAREIYASLNQYAIHARSLSADGAITLKEGSSSQSGSFELKSKRIDPTGLRIDSLSMVVSGPFGITAAKFMGSPKEYAFINVLQGERYRGKPDPKTIEEMTGMKGLTIEALSNVIYGLAPNLDQLGPLDSAFLRSIKKDEHLLYLHRVRSGITEMLRLRGILGSGSPLSLTEYQRWNSPVSLSGSPMPSADLAITYEGAISSDKYRLPNYIRAQSAGRELEVEYRNAKQNPDPLTVKIKIPE